MSIIRSTLLAAAETAAYLISRSVRLRSSASAYFNRTFSSSGTDLKKWTLSFWIKRGTLGVQSVPFSSQDTPVTGAASLYFLFSTSNTFAVFYPNTATTLSAATTAVFRDTSAWYHFVITYDSTQATNTDRIKIYVNGVQQALSSPVYPSLNATTSWNSNCAHFISKNPVSAADYLDGYITEINSIDGQALTPSAFGETDLITGVWKPKKYSGTYGTNGFYLPTSNNATVEALGYDMANGNPELISNGQFISNVTGWTTLNGTTLSWQSGSLARVANTASAAGIAYIPITTVVGQTYYVSSVIAAYNAGAAGRTVGIRKSDDSGYTVNPVLVCSATSATAISGTFTATATTTYIQMFVDVFGTGSCDFSFVSVSLGGYKNHWKPNNISLTAGATYDSMIDTPTMYDDGGTGRGNYAVLLSTAGQGNGAYSDGNLGFKSPTANQWKGAHSSIFVPSGKFYFEATIQALSANNYFMIGACGIQTNATLYANYTGKVANGWAVQCNGATGGAKYNNDTITNISNASFASWVAGDTLQCAVDVDNGRIWFGRNNVWLEGNPSAGTGASYTNLTGVISPSVSVYTNGVDKFAVNFGQRPFAYTPPTGFKAVNTFNLAAPTIPNGATQFAATTYTGTGSARSVTNTVNGVSFQPDLIWSKSRSNAYNHYIEDSIRGATKALSTNQTIAEFTGAQLVTSFNSNGFSVGTDAEINGNAATFVGWQWKASNAAPVTNTSGSITSSVSANPSAGFSIVTYTGTSVAGTIGHGLGIAPKMIIVKPRTATVTTDSWNVYHSSIGNTQFLVLDSTAAAVTANTRWNNTSPTSSVFSIGTVPSSNGVSYVAYCFAEVAGFSKFGSYTGNGSADGPFVYLGFRPRFIMYKCTTAAENWEMVDTSRNPSNVGTDQWLYANLSNAEGTTSAGASTDILSNGFKLKGLTGTPNTSGATYIFMAFAESPFNYSLAR